MLDLPADTTPGADPLLATVRLAGWLDPSGTNSGPGTFRVRIRGRLPWLAGPVGLSRGLPGPRRGVRLGRNDGTTAEPVGVVASVDEVLPVSLDLTGLEQGSPRREITRRLY